MTDIVERLRTKRVDLNGDILHEAAAEIKRLREKLADIYDAAQHLRGVIVGRQGTYNYPKQMRDAATQFILQVATAKGEGDEGV
jgi:hypothetical protein